MDREIKFRGKRADNGEWVYGDLEYNRAKDIVRIHSYDGDGNYIGQNVVDESTIGQLAGLKDCNGKEIYEGEIVVWRNRNYVVKFWQGMFYASVEECNKEIYGGFPLHALTTTACNADVCAIVGNRFDNPELLK